LQATKWAVQECRPPSVSITGAKGIYGSRK
jgi:hypothetical protein